MIPIRSLVCCLLVSLSALACGGSDGQSEPSPDAGLPDYCAPCEEAAVSMAYACPAHRPTTESELRSHCTGFLGTGRASATVKLGECTISSGQPLPGCNATSPDPNVDVLSVISFPVGFDCHYARASGLLVGQAVSADSPRYCGNRAYVATTAGVTNPWCIAGGTNALSVTCTSGEGAGVDSGMAAPIDAAVASACPACAPDELCVALYDGTCKPMSSGCRKVSAETRDRILVKHENCFMKPLGDEVCGNKPGQSLFWGCGAPPCLNEPLLSDINCYGP